MGYLVNIYVVDTNIFSRALKDLSFDVFNDIYLSWSKGMKNGTIISVDEVYHELDRLWGAEVTEKKDKKKDRRTKEGMWLKQHKNAFQSMTDEEGKIVAEIFKNKKFREGVKEKSLRVGTPEADAILVAKAKYVDGIIVTDESDNKPNADKIPNICVAFEVPFISRNDFYRVLRNISNDKPELENVIIKRSLQII